MYLQTSRGNNDCWGSEQRTQTKTPSIDSSWMIRTFAPVILATKLASRIIIFHNALQYQLPYPRHLRKVLFGMHPGDCAKPQGQCHCPFDGTCHPRQTFWCTPGTWKDSLLPSWHKCHHPQGEFCLHLSLATWASNSSYHY